MANEPATQKISISLPGSLLSALDAHLKPNESRSGYFQIIAIRDLEDKGVLVSSSADQEADDIALIREARAAGIDIAATLQAALVTNLAQ